MSYAVPPVDLSGLVVGNANITAMADWTGKVSTGSPLGTKAGRATVRLRNESNFGLFYTLGRHSGHFGAGEWSDIVFDGQNSVSVYAEYQLVGSSPNLLLATIFEPGEPVPPSPTLGNSSVQGISSLSTKIPVNTTGGNQTAIELGADPHSLADWEFIVTQAGDLVIYDNKNGRNVAVLHLADGSLLAQGMLEWGAGIGGIFSSAEWLGSPNFLQRYHTPESGANASAHVFFSWDGASNHQPLGIGNNALNSGSKTIIGDAGIFLDVAGQLTAGSFGVPVCVAQASVTISVITLVTVLSFTPSATGLYRINASFNANNGGTNKPGIALNWTGGKSGVATASTMYVDTVPMDQTNTVTGNRDFNMGTKSFYAASGGAITLTYINNGAASANDFVTATLERLS